MRRQAIGFEYVVWDCGVKIKKLPMNPLMRVPEYFQRFKTCDIFKATLSMPAHDLVAIKIW